MNTVKNSREVFQKWRSDIPWKYLSQIQTTPSCRRAIEWMGHAQFLSDREAKDTNGVSLFAQ